MKGFPSTVLALALAIPATAQRNVLVPESSVHRAGAIHTNHLMLVGAEELLGAPVALDARSNDDVSGPALRQSGAYLTPAKVRTAYNLPSDGGSGAIAVVVAYNYATALNDFNVFSRQYDLPAETAKKDTNPNNRVFQVVYGHGRKPVNNASWAQEAALDVEWAHAMAPQAKIYLVEANSNSNVDLFAAVRLASNLPGVRQVSVSWGGAESLGETSYDASMTQPGVVYFCASGDVGGQSDYPSESPNVVCVGGTTLNLDASGNVISETAWSGSGGGPSAYEDTPFFQSGILDLVGTHRGGPDISFVADPNTGVYVYDSTPYQGYAGWMVFGGTSVSAPAMAGVCNLAGRNLGSSAAENAFVYSLLGSPNFRDITSGVAGSFTAASGWDFITGVGSPLGLGGI